jgi:hypothetical protein
MLTRVQIGHTRLMQGNLLREDLTPFCNAAVYPLHLTFASVMQRYDADPSTFYHQGYNTCNAMTLIRDTVVAKSV